MSTEPIASHEYLATSREFRIAAVRGADCTERMDSVTVEEPLEIRLRLAERNEPISMAITMRTPGNDEELATGFLWSEGILTDARHLLHVRQSGPIQPGGHRNIVEVAVTEVPGDVLENSARNFYMTSSCGICGKASIDAVEQARPFLLPAGTLQFPLSVITKMPNILRDAQETFERTGGLHAAGLFDVHSNLSILREDVGRHNAVDKLIGAAIGANTLPLSESLLFVSGRTSFELVQKAAMAGIPALAAVGAPSSLAVTLARAANMTLIGFVRGDRFNIYSGGERIVVEERASHG